MPLHGNINSWIFQNNSPAIFGGGAPFESDLATKHDSVSDDTFTESIESLNAEFIPACFKGNNSAYYTLPATAFVFDNTDFEIEFDFYADALSGDNYICGSFQDAQNRWRILINSSGNIQLIAEKDNIVYQVTTGNGAVSTGTYYVIKMQIGRDGTNAIIINGVADTLLIDNTVANFDNTATKEIMAYATLYNLEYKCSYCKSTKAGVLAEHYILPSGYDISGSDRHATGASMVTANTSYLSGGSTHLNDVGYSLWKHATSPDIQVPYNLAGAALALTAGVGIPSGYTKTFDVPNVSGKWNMADCLVGFNEAGAADTELEIFDRLNATRQSAISRAADYYDATSLATRSRYHITEITDPRIYFEFFNTGYAGRIFGKVDLQLISTTYYFKYYYEELNYATDKTGAEQYAVMQYCNIDVFAE